MYTHKSCLTRQVRFNKSLNHSSKLPCFAYPLKTRRPLWHRTPPLVEIRNAMARSDPTTAPAMSPNDIDMPILVEAVGCRSCCPRKCSSAGSSDCRCCCEGNNLGIGGRVKSKPSPKSGKSGSCKASPCRIQSQPCSSRASLA